MRPQTGHQGAWTSYCPLIRTRPSPGGSVPGPGYGQAKKMGGRWLRGRCWRTQDKSRNRVLRRSHGYRWKIGPTQVIILGKGTAIACCLSCCGKLNERGGCVLTSGRERGPCPVAAGSTYGCEEQENKVPSQAQQQQATNQWPPLTGHKSWSYASWKDGDPGGVSPGL